MKLPDVSKGWARAVRATLTTWFDCLAVLGVRRQQDGVAVIKIDAIGDFILWVNSGRELRAIYPGKKITLVANDAWASLARNLPYWDDVVPVQMKRFVVNLRYRWTMLRRLRRAGFQLAVQPTVSRHFLTGDPLIRATGAARRIGSVGDLSLMTIREKRTADAWYTQLIPFTERGLTELELHAEFTARIAQRAFPAQLPCLPRFEIGGLPAPVAGAYFIVFPGASWVGRQWPVDRFAALITALRVDLDASPVLCGSAAEVDLCASIAARCPTPVLNLAGKTSLTEFAELVRHSLFLVGNETSCIHMAAAVGTPSVCILGGGHFGRFLPYPRDAQAHNPRVVFHSMPCFGCNWTCHQPHESGGPVPCITGVSVDAVIESVRQLEGYSWRKR